MTASARLLEAADRNIITAFSALIPIVNAGGFVRTFGGVTGVVTGVAHPFYNPIFVLSKAATAEGISATLEAVRAAGREPMILVREDVHESVEGHVRMLGFEADAWRTPVMVLDPVPAVAPSAPDSLRIEVLGAGSGAADKIEAFHEASGSDAIFRSSLTPRALPDDAFRLLIGSDDAGPVSCSMAIRSEREFGVYAVATVERARRRGYGTASTWAAIEAGRQAWGLETVVLQSSEMGRGVYSKMGFVEVSRYVEYSASAPTQAIKRRRSSAARASRDATK